MIEEGKYKAKLIDIGVGESPNTGTPYIYTTWELETGDERTVKTYLSEKSFETGKQKLDTIGFNGDFKNPDCEIKNTTLTCKHEEDNRPEFEGVMRERWDFSNWGGESKHKEAENSTIRTLNAQWKNAGGIKKTITSDQIEVDVSKARAAAWGAWSDNKKNLGIERTDLVTRWSGLCSDLFPDKEENDFTSADWAEIEKSAAVPF